MSVVGFPNRKMPNLIRASGISGHKNLGLGGVSLNSSLNTTWQAKFNVDGDFDAIRLVYYNHQPNDISSLQAVVAVTETAATNTTDNLSQPIVAGTARATKDSSSSPYGWRSVTWFGNESAVAIPLAAQNWPLDVFSDWIPLRSVPRADGGRGRLILVRTYINGSLNNYAFVSTNHLSTLLRDPTQANRGMIYQVGSFSGDAVGAVTNSPTALATSGHAIGIQLRRRGPAMTVMGIGDSTYENRTLVADKASSFGFRACADVSTDALPVGWVNQAIASQTSEYYYYLGMQGILDWNPDIVVFEGLSPNDTTSTVDVFRLNTTRRMTRLHNMLDLCQKNGTTLIVSTGIPKNYSSAIDVERETANSFIRDMANRGLVLLADFDLALRDPNMRSRIRAEYNFGDDIHPNEAGVEIMAGVLREQLASVVSTYKGA